MIYRSEDIIWPTDDYYGYWSYYTDGCVKYMYLCLMLIVLFVSYVINNTI